MNNNQQFQWRYLHPRFWLTWLGIGCWRLVVLLPYPVMMWLGRLLGAILYFMGGYRYQVAEINLALCFPEMSEVQRRQLLRDNFASYGIGFFEVGMAWWWPTERLNKYIQLEGMEHIEALNGRGALLMAIHYTTLEVGASALSARHSIDGMYRPHKSAVYDYVQSKGRRVRNPAGVVYPREDVRGMFKALRQGRIIWYAPDQDYGRKQSVFANFFGVPAASVTATARFAKVGNAAILPFSPFTLRLRTSPQVMRLLMRKRSIAELKHLFLNNLTSIYGLTGVLKRVLRANNVLIPKRNDGKHVAR